MTKMTFKLVDDRDGRTVVIEINATDKEWSSLVRDFQDFLRACGFFFSEGFLFDEILSYEHQAIIDAKYKGVEKEKKNGK